MPVSLQKGGNISLSKEAPTMEKAIVGLGWDVRMTDGQAFDLDASAFLLNEKDEVINDKGFVFYGQTTSGCSSVNHLGDNRTGEGDGDDEQLTIEFSKVPAEVKKVVIAVTIHDAEKLQQNFGQVSNAFIRVVNDGDNTEIARYDLSEDASTNTAMLFGELYRHGEEWKFRAVGQGFDGGLAALCAAFGVKIG